MSRIKISIDGIIPEPGTVIIAKATSDIVTQKEAIEIYKTLKECFPENKVFLCPSDIRIKQLSNEQFWNFIDSLKYQRAKGEREEHIM